MSRFKLFESINMQEESLTIHCFGVYSFYSHDPFDVSEWLTDQNSNCQYTFRVEM